MRGFLSLLLAAVACLLALAGLDAARAQESSKAGIPVSCHTYSDRVLSMEQALTGLEWRCDRQGWQDGRTVTWLRFPTTDLAEKPVAFASRTTVFESFAIAAIIDGRIAAEAHFRLDQAVPVPAGPVFTYPVPETSAVPHEYLVRIVRPHSVTAGSEAHMWMRGHARYELLAPLVILAVVTGMLVMPLLFDGMFYLVLRERFVLLHAGMTVAMLIYALASGGVITAFAELPVDLLARLGPIAWALGVGLAGLFITAFLERDALPRWQRRLLFTTAVWTMIVPGFAGLQLAVSQSFDNQLYFMAFVPVIPIYLVAILTALTRGSRAAKFLAAAWLPVALASLDRLLRGLGVFVSTDSADVALFVALGMEVIVVGLGVADRFLAVRRERDRAVTEARTLEELSERDALTGLLNRRAIEDRFARLRAGGFITLAVIDLDHFKEINDRHGHAAGDMVLRNVAAALRSDDVDSLVFRIGGEEFVVLLRGSRTLERAERKRQAITEAVLQSGAVPDRVTASMGIVEAPHDSLADTGFEKLYARADRLLYEAKASGRDRTMAERLRVFGRRREDRRAAA